MPSNLFEQLHTDGHLSSESLQKIKLSKANTLFSVHWELKTILYLGVLLLSGGLGILVYKNIDTIGHQAILFFIGALCTGSFFYCFKNKLPYSNNIVAAPNAFFDYVLLLACLTFITFVGYLQYQYNVFGNRYGLVTFIPMLLLFFTAYYFDHLGILTMAISTLAAWAGISVTPMSVLQENDFDSVTIIFTAFTLGVVLVTLGYFSTKENIKKHFEFTYNNFGIHLLFISTIAAMFHFENICWLIFILLAGIGYLVYQKSSKEKSFYLLLILSLYVYIGFSYLVTRLLFDIMHVDTDTVVLACFYFIGSAIGIMIFLIKMNKLFKSNDSLQ
jgi:hypothetical protein